LVTTYQQRFTVVQALAACVYKQQNRMSIIELPKEKNLNKNNI